jgi:hypothetical protein
VGATLSGMPTIPNLAALPPLVSDLVFFGLTLAFFAVALAFAWFCEQVR